MIKNLNALFVTMFGLGKIPKIPGTFGSLATIIILYLLPYIKFAFKFNTDSFGSYFYFLFCS